jgi:hypothetical protein
MWHTYNRNSMETIKINPKDLQFSPWNVNTVSPENMEKLKKSVERNGIFRPVVVRELADGTHEVIAGEHTTRVAIELGHETIDVYNLGVISDLKAKEISIIDNQHFGVEDQFGMGKILQEIQDSGDVMVGEFLPFSDRDLNTIFRSTKIDLETLDLDEEVDSLIPDYRPEDSVARAPVTHQQMRFKVPLKDAEFVTRVIEGIIKRQGLKQSDSLASAGDALVWLCNNRGTEE